MLVIKDMTFESSNGPIIKIAGYETHKYIKGKSNNGSWWIEFDTPLGETIILDEHTDKHTIGERRIVIENALGKNIDKITIPYDKEKGTKFVYP